MLELSAGVECSCSDGELAALGEVLRVDGNCAIRPSRPASTHLPVIIDGKCNVAGGSPLPLSLTGDYYLQVQPRRENRQVCPLTVDFLLPSAASSGLIVDPPVRTALPAARRGRRPSRQAMALPRRLRHLKGVRLGDS